MEVLLVSIKFFTIQALILRNVYHGWDSEQSQRRTGVFTLLLFQTSVKIV